jgi:hypothetical protein
LGNPSIPSAGSGPRRSRGCRKAPSHGNL